MIGAPVMAEITNEPPEVNVWYLYPSPGVVTVPPVAVIESATGVTSTHAVPLWMRRVTASPPRCRRRRASLR